MAEKENNSSALLDKIYSMLIVLKEEVSRLSLQVKALRNEMKGMTDNGEKL